MVTHKRQLATTIDKKLLDEMKIASIHYEIKLNTLIEIMWKSSRQNIESIIDKYKN